MGQLKIWLSILALLLAEGVVLVVMATAGAFLMPILISGELANPSPFWELLGLLFVVRLVWVLRDAGGLVFPSSRPQVKSK